MIVLLVPVLFMIAGALLMALSKNPTVVKMGEWLFAAGAFAIAFAFANKTLHLL